MLAGLMLIGAILVTYLAVREMYKLYCNNLKRKTARLVYINEAWRQAKWKEIDYTFIFNLIDKPMVS